MRRICIAFNHRVLPIPDVTNYDMKKKMKKQLQKTPDSVWGLMGFEPTYFLCRENLKRSIPTTTPALEKYCDNFQYVSHTRIYI